MEDFEYHLLYQGLTIITSSMNKKTGMKKFNTTLLLSFMFAGLIGVTYAYAASPTTVSLGAASNFAVLAGSSITNTGSSVITGDLGLSPGTAVTGFPPGMVSGTQHVADTQAASAQTALVNAYNDASGQTPVSTIPTELGGTTLVPGVYSSSAGTFGLTGTLTLNAGGDASAVFIFKTASTLITAAGSNVVLTGGAQACNVFWEVGSSATIGANSSLKGNILALSSITLTTGANVEGRLLARNGAVTLEANTITRAMCAAPVVPTPTPVVTTVTPVVATTATITPVVVAVTPTVVAVTPVVATKATVTIPKLPNTGIDPNTTTPWNAVIPVGIATSLVVFIAVRRKYTV
jgi:hypothetical protein